MRNERGSILVITTGFVLIFTLLGIATLYIATLQNEMAEKQKASSEAFWLADGAIAMAKIELPNLINYANPSTQLDAHRSYDVFSIPYTSGGTIVQNKWVIESLGIVNNQQRAIQVVIDNNVIPPNPVTSKGPVPCPQQVQLNCNDINITPEDVLPDDIKDLATITATDPEELDLAAGDIVLINLENSDNLELFTDALEDITVIIVDATVANDNSLIPEIEFIGTDVFTGILVVIGQTQIIDPNIEGTVVINNDPNDETIISGRGKIVFSSEAVNTAVSNLGTNFTGKIKVVSWKEL